MDAQEIDRRLTPRVKNVVCYNTHLRIVNQIIYKEFIFAKWEGRNDWAERASVRLERDHGITRAPRTLRSLLGQIRNGSRDAVAASDFTQGISYDSVPSSRYEKDAMHARMETLICEYLDGHKLHYVGLPANQIVSILRTYDTIVACEKDPQMAKFIFDMNKYICKSPWVKVHNGNIFDFLENTNRKFNVFEFDMMCAINSKMIRRIANTTLKTALSPALIVVISIGGRHISTNEYETLMPGTLIGEIEKSGEWSVINNGWYAGGRYKDIKIPMRYELLVIQKDDDDADYDPEYYQEREGEFVIEDKLQVESSRRSPSTVTRDSGSRWGRVGAAPYFITFKSREGRILKFLYQYCKEYFNNIVKTRTAFANLTDDQVALVNSISENIVKVGEELTEHQRNILNMHINGMNQSQIADALGIHQTSVHKALHGNFDYDYEKTYGGIFKKVLRFYRKDEKFMNLVARL